MKKCISLMLIVTVLFVWLVPSNTLAENSFKRLNSPGILQYTEDQIYSRLSEELGSEDYIIDNVKAIYISEEYLEELAFNSEENIFFGYKL